MELQKIVNLVDATYEDKDLPEFVTKKKKKGLKFMINQEEKITMLTKKLELKHQC